MKALHLLAASAALSGLLTVAAAEAEAQQPVAGSGPRMTIPRDGGPFGGGKHHGGKHHGGHFPGFILVEREPTVIIEREVVVREVAPAAPVAPPPPPRKPYVIGNSYASLPGGCMKMIEGGASFYYCGGGEWYRLVGKQYRAVAQP